MEFNIQLYCQLRRGSWKDCLLKSYNTLSLYNNFDYSFWIDTAGIPSIFTVFINDFHHS
ncbi:hypothetical protein Pla110_17700 [Polystyrenella longa]|uniref:Uncharacterized protein n=1 Tax=Polystyrenella longa TaxID=2528007 RepID=A0A518CLE4_9PLAN|nr:hypothetical protein Pla110_17700 [Polystyrenella longa]